MLRRKQGIKRSQKPLKRSALARVSDKRRVAAAIYRAERIMFLKGRPKCEVCNKRASSDVHHKAGRTGTNYLDQLTWMAVCRECHEEIHRNPSWARRNDYLK